MNTISTDFRFIVEDDIHPFLLFDKNGKVKYLNQSAERLSGSCPVGELYQLALQYAPKDFGSRMIYIDLHYRTYLFYAIRVMYENEEEIGLYLYNKPTMINDSRLGNNTVSTDLNMLIEAQITLFQTRFSGALQLMTDYQFPRIQINQNAFSILLRKIFSQFSETEEVRVTVNIKVGESVIIDEKKYPLLVLEVRGEGRKEEEDGKIALLAQEQMIKPYLLPERILLDIPFIADND